MAESTIVLTMPPIIAAQGESYWDLVLRQFRRNRLAVVSLIFVLLLFVVAIGAPFLASNQPIVLVGSFNGLYQDRFEEWQLGGHPELMEALRNGAGASPEIQRFRLSLRMGVVERQLQYMASQLPSEPAALLLRYLDDYRTAVQMTLDGQPSQLELLEGNAQQMAQTFDPAAVQFEAKTYWPAFAALTPIDIFFLTVAVLVLLLPLLRRFLPLSWRESWRRQMLVVLFPALLFSALWLRRPSVFETLDYKDELRTGAIH